MYILDTNVISELRKSHGKTDTNVMTWFGTVDAAALYLSAVTLMELEIGVLRLERRDVQQAALIRIWLNDRIVPEFKERILPVDASVAIRCAQLHAPKPCTERDALIAATALVHNLTVVTRNVADFAPTGVASLNPWDAR